MSAVMKDNAGTLATNNITPILSYDARKTAVLAYFTEHGKATAAIRASYRDNDWAAVNDALGMLSSDNASHKARAASFRSMVQNNSPYDDEVKTVVKHGDTFIIADKGTSKGKTRAIGSFKKRLNPIIEDLQQCENFEQFDALKAALLEHLDTLIPLATDWEPVYENNIKGLRQLEED